jgi:8-oxo-dGTP pyrophosphatase MutT (NUDIX family)
MTPSLPSAHSRDVYGTIIVSPRERYLLVRGRATGKWSFPKGHKEFDEDPLTCAMRELYEETGIRLGGQRPTLGPIRLKAAYYFVFRPDREFQPVIYDTNEVTDVRWFTLQEIATLSGNIDVSDFLRRNKMQPMSRSNIVSRSVIPSISLLLQ